MDKKQNYFKIVLEEISYRYFLIKNNLQEFKFCILGINRKFYCQCDIEGQSKCKIQCDHCKEYYALLEKEN